jgi:chromate transporter
MSLLDILFAFMKIGVLAFGGAYAAIPIVEKEVVFVNGWMTYQEFGYLLTLDELTPGPILINSATFVGMKLKGIPGAICATIGCILPAMIISLILVLIYRKYKKLSIMESIMATLKCMSIALIASTFLRIFIDALFGGGSISIGNIDLIALPLMIISYLIMRKKKTNPILIMLGCGLINLLVHLII